MPSHRRYEGECLIDHKHSPGISEQDIAKWPAWMRRSYPDAKDVAKGKTYESAVCKCNHCNRGIMIHPLRNRPRNYCRGCDHYICEDCALLMKLGNRCSPFGQKVELELDKQQRIII